MCVGFIEWGTENEVDLFVNTFEVPLFYDSHNQLHLLWKRIIKSI
jgi:hypothetical protein